MKDFLLSTVRAMADHPEAVRVAMINGARTAVFEVRCDKRDLGRLIGRNGRTIGAVQILVGNVAARHKKRAIVEITD